MKQVFIKNGNAIVDEVPAPLVEPGHALVEVAYSLISIGTEMAGVAESGKPLLKKAMERPEQVLKLVDHLRQRGWQKTFTKVQGKRKRQNV